MAKQPHQPTADPLIPLRARWQSMVDHMQTSARDRAVDFLFNASPGELSDAVHRSYASERDKKE